MGQEEQQRGQILKPKINERNPTTTTTTYEKKQIKPTKFSQPQSNI